MTGPLDPSASAVARLDGTSSDSPRAEDFPRDGLLRAALAGNAAFSTLSGAVALVRPDAVSSVLGGLPPSWIQLLGVSLVGFALVVGFVASRSPVHPIAGALISVADIGWVVGSGVVIALGGDALGVTGILIVGGVALAVAGFAGGQLAGLRRYARNIGGRTSARSRFDLVQHVPADPDLVWDRLRDLGRIGEFYADLTDVRVEESEGALRRTCGIDESQWSEEVLVMNDMTRELVLEFDLSAGRAPLPATDMVGGWLVEPARDGSRVRLWYEYTLRWGWIGEVLAAVMAAIYRRQLTPVVDRIGQPDRRVAPSGQLGREKQSR